MRAWPSPSGAVGLRDDRRSDRSPPGLTSAARRAEADLRAAAGSGADLDVAAAAVAVTETEFMHFKMALEKMQYAAGARARARWDARTAAEARAQCAIARDVLGNPFRPVAFDPAWRTADVVGLARAIYEDRAFDRLPVLADALMDAGCTDPAILAHCRGDGPHVRGCWVVDLVPGKE